MLVCLEAVCHILFSPDSCVTTKFILLQQLLLNTIPNILLSAKRLNMVGDGLTNTVNTRISITSLWFVCL
jgi:hypothetical protein